MDDSVLASIGARLDARNATFALTLGPRRYNRKPVVQVIDLAGETVAFIKVAAGRVTADFVATETYWLRRASASTARFLAVPEVVDDWTWNDRPVVALGPAHPSGHQPQLLDDQRIRALVDDVAAIGDQHQRTVADSSFLQRVAAAATAASDERLSRAVDRAATTWDNVDVVFGVWHGDLTPWNMITTATSTVVLDWEFAAGDVPLGMDLLHNRLMVDTHLDNVPIAAALRSLTQSSRELVHDANAAAVETVLDLYLLELARRDAVLAHHGVPETGFGRRALELLESPDRTSMTRKQR